MLEDILSAASANMTATVEAAVFPIFESLQTLEKQVTSSLDALEGKSTATAKALTKETSSVSSLYGHLLKTELPKLSTKLEVDASLATLEAHINAQPPPTVTDHTTTQAEPRVDKCPTVKPRITNCTPDSVVDNHPSELSDDVITHTRDAYTTFREHNTWLNVLTSGDPTVPQ